MAIWISFDGNHVKIEYTREYRHIRAVFSNLGYHMAADNIIYYHKEEKTIECQNTRSL
jgi:hypothetical protein